MAENLKDPIKSSFLKEYEKCFENANDPYRVFNAATLHGTLRRLDPQPQNPYSMVDARKKIEITMNARGSYPDMAGDHAIFCHTSVYRELTDMVEPIKHEFRAEAERYGAYRPFDLKIIDNYLLSPRQNFPVIKYNDTKFCKYSAGPSDPASMTWEEYEKMCVYFGWARIEYETRKVFYLVNGQPLTYEYLPQLF